MKMAARFLVRCTAGMKNGRSFRGWYAGNFHCLEAVRWHERNLRPAPGKRGRHSAIRANVCRRRFPRFTNFSIHVIVLELAGKKFHRQGVKILALKTGTDGLAQARGETGKFRVHAVFVCGWFSATAEDYDNTKPLRCK